MKLLIVGKNSHALDSILRPLEFDEVKFLDPFDGKYIYKPSMQQIRELRRPLLKRLRKNNGYVIMGLGSMAVKMFTCLGSKSTVAHFRGRQIAIAETNIHGYITYDPSTEDHGYENPERRALVIEDFERLNKSVLPWPREKYPSGKVLGFDTEFTPTQILDVAISNATASKRIDPKDKKSLKKIFQTPQLIGHGVGRDVTQLVRLGCKRNDWLQGKNLFDSFIISRLADENRGRGNYTVDSILLSKINTQSWKEKTTVISIEDPLKWGKELREERCRLDAWAAYHNVKNWWDDAKGPVELQTAIAATLERVFLAGAYVDVAYYAKWKKEVGLKHKQAEAKLKQIAMRYRIAEFSPTKPDDIRTLFFKKMKLPVEERTKKDHKPAVTKAWLHRHKTEYKEVQAVLDFRKVDKLWRTYVLGVSKKFISLPNSQVFIPFRLGTMATRTGRRASDKPNAQNWPKSARHIICSRWPNGLIAANDFSKLEIILLAWEAGDEQLMDYFTKSKNGYIEIGSKLFSKTVEEGTNDYRFIKAIILGINYNLQTYGLAKQLWDEGGVRLASSFESHEEHVDEYRKKYLRMFPKITAYQRERVREIHHTGYSELWLGQRRRLPIPKPPDRSQGKDAYKAWRKTVAHLENEAINGRIQNAASYVTGTAMLDVERALLKEYKLSYAEYHYALAMGNSKELNMPLLINEVHDELTYDVPKKEVKKAKEIIQDGMTSLRTLKKLKPEFDAPIKVSQDFTSHWGLKE